MPNDQEQEPNRDIKTHSNTKALKIGLGAIVGAALIAAEAKAKTEENLPDLNFPIPLTQDFPSDKIVLRMQRELQQALLKPEQQRKWAMVIDLRKCIGCHSCTVACQAENVLPPGVIYRPVTEQEGGVYPQVRLHFLPQPCMHCTIPPCTKVCPVAATYKRDDGVVVVDYTKCIGCQRCISVCPYGARSFDKGSYYTNSTPQHEPYESEPSFEYGGDWFRQPGSIKPPINKVRKCHFCLERIEAGMLPACVNTCLGRATYFGDLNNDTSLINGLIKSNSVMKLKEELKTGPNVYYLV
ncbi:tetrathionate reductase subunit B precursor [Desulfosporosinus acididurans]|uniref:Tetrathionate reductase subunit B n=1 Tax=Desulfosporosinus acididurans TaxID=476652 RepID=A0A0J1FP25_9FIRM|nr:4Fe-4S dicluster domain-containing protein [Desulfosporosinus acididurans]KLU65245.1 tetrathionate reductase subunit B precursor [Desulfosporosinus acididurans]